MIQAICLDMDDTLIVNQVLYANAEFMLAGYLQNFGVKPEETFAAIRTAEAENFKTLGICISRFPLSFEQALLHFIPAADATMIATVRDFAERVFRTVADVKPDIVPALDMLARIAPLHIITGGADSVQHFRIDHLPFKDKFNSFTVVPKKDASVYRAAAQKLGIAPAHLVMIGDSLRSDVLPAVEAGWQGVWIEALNASHELKAADLPQGAHKFSSLLELARYLEANKGQLPKRQPANSNKPAAARAFARGPKNK